MTFFPQLQEVGDKFMRTQTKKEYETDWRTRQEKSDNGLKTGQEMEV